MVEDCFPFGREYRHSNPDTSWDSQYPYLPQQREQLLTLANAILMSLHRPHIVAHSESRRAALQAAIVGLEAQQRIFDQTPKHRHKLFGLTFFTIDAGILLAVIAGMDLPHHYVVKQQVIDLLQRSIARLTSIQDVNSTANAGLKILSRCYQKLTELSVTTNMTLGIPTATDFMEHINGQFSDLETADLNGGNAQLDGDVGYTDIQSGEDILENNFDVPFWLDQVGSIPFASPSSFDRDLVWESLQFG